MAARYFACDRDRRSPPVVRYARDVRYARSWENSNTRTAHSRHSRREVRGKRPKIRRGNGAFEISALPSGSLFRYNITARSLYFATIIAKLHINVRKLYGGGEASGGKFKGCSIIDVSHSIYSRLLRKPYRYLLSAILTCHEITNCVNNIFFNYVERTITRIIFAYVNWVSINNLTSPSRRLYNGNLFYRNARRRSFISILFLSFISKTCKYFIAEIRYLHILKASQIRAKDFKMSLG